MKAWEVAIGYSERVVEGQEVASRWVQQACGRFLEDLDSADETYLFDGDAAERALRIARLCHYYKGPKAGQRFEPEPFQVFILANIFGWKHSASGLRRFRIAYIEMARKNGKTFLAAVILIILFFGDDEGGAEIYTAGPTEEVAGYVFKAIRAIVRRSPGLQKRCVSTKSIVERKPLMESFIRPISSNEESLDGKDVHGASVDEYHLHPDSTVYDSLFEGTAARTQAMVVVITTAGKSIETACGQMRLLAEAVIDPKNDFQDPAFFAFIAALDEQACDDYADSACWKKANPNLGVSVLPSFLLGEIERSMVSPAKVRTVKQKHFGVWAGKLAGLFDMALWDACDRPFDVEALAGERCFGGLDLSSTTDFTSFELLFPDCQSAPFPVVLSWFFLPEEELERRAREDRAPYELWAEQGFLITTPGPIIDYEIVEETILEAAARYSIKEIAYDPSNATASVARLGEQLGRKTMARYGQTGHWMSAPTKELLRMLKARAWSHGGNPVLRWMAGNTAGDENEKRGTIRPVKTTKTDRIDGIVALVMALGRAMVQPDLGSLAGYVRQGKNPRRRRRRFKGDVFSC